jgi:hypothetical protein
MDIYIIFCFVAWIFAVLAYYFAGWFEQRREDIEVRKEMKAYLDRVKRQFDEEN